MTTKDQKKWFFEIIRIIGDFSSMDMKSVLDHCQDIIDAYHKTQKEYRLYEIVQGNGHVNAYPELISQRNRSMYRLNNYDHLTSNGKQHKEAQLASILLDEWRDLVSVLESYCSPPVTLPAPQNISFDCLWKMDQLKRIPKVDRLFLSLPSLGILTNSSLVGPLSLQLSLNPFDHFPENYFPEEAPETEKTRKRRLEFGSDIYALVKYLKTESKLEVGKKKDEYERYKIESYVPDYTSDYISRQYYGKVSEIVQSWIYYDISIILMSRLNSARKSIKECAEIYSTPQDNAPVFSPIGHFRYNTEWNDKWADQVTTTNNYVLEIIQFDPNDYHGLSTDEVKKKLYEMEQLHHEEIENAKRQSITQVDSLLSHEIQLLEDKCYDYITDDIRNQYNIRNQYSAKEKTIEQSISTINEIFRHFQTGEVACPDKDFSHLFPIWNQCHENFEHWLELREMHTSTRPIATPFSEMAIQSIEFIREKMLTKIQMEFVPFLPASQLQDEVMTIDEVHSCMDENMRDVHKKVTSAAIKRAVISWAERFSRVKEEGQKVIYQIIHALESEHIKKTEKKLKRLEESHHYLWNTPSFSKYKLSPTQKQGVRVIIDAISGPQPWTWSDTQFKTYFTWPALSIHLHDVIDNAEMDQNLLLSLCRNLCKIAVRSQFV
jgi:hypothetical protein